MDRLCWAELLVAFLLLLQGGAYDKNNIQCVAADDASEAAVEVNGKDRLMVGMTLLPRASSSGAVCLDGSPPAYHLHRGTGDGARNWLLQFEGGGWCNDVASCLERAPTRRGSTKYMTKMEVFSGILSNQAIKNPDFYNWNRVKLRYCDGASFGGDSEYRNGTTLIHFRGQKIFKAIILDLLQKGLNQSEKVLLSGCSAGGLATFLHCDNLATFLPQSASLKCMSDAGFFLDVNDISGNNSIRPFFQGVVDLQMVQSALNNCTKFNNSTYQCFFPQHALPYIKTPYFILNSAYDEYQFHHIFVPPSADPRGEWRNCKLNLASCTPIQLAILRGYRLEMIEALGTFGKGKEDGMYINSCFVHCQSELQETWFGPESPRLHNKTIAEVVGDWYFDREVAKEIDCPYPCDSTCPDSVPVNQGEGFLGCTHGCLIAMLIFGIHLI